MCQSSAREVTILPITHAMFKGKCMKLFENISTELLFQSNCDYDHFEWYDFESNFLVPVMKHQYSMYVMVEKMSEETPNFETTPINTPISFEENIYIILAVMNGYRDEQMKRFKVHRLVRFEKNFIPYMEVDNYECESLLGHAYTQDERHFWGQYTQKYKMT